MQAGLTCLFIEQHFGFDRLVAFLYEFKKETTVGAAVKAAMKVSPAEFDKEFDAFMKQRYAALLPHMDEWQHNYKAAYEAIEEKKWPAAIEAARKAVAMYGEYVGDGSPYLLLAKAYKESKQPAQALQTLLDYRHAGGWDPEALRELARDLQASGRSADAIEVLLAVNYGDPLKEESHASLGDALLAAQRPQEAMREYRTLLALDTHDKATAHLGIARALRSMGDRAQAKRSVLQALETAPSFRDAQKLLLEMTDERE